MESVQKSEIRVFEDVEFSDDEDDDFQYGLVNDHISDEDGNDSDDNDEDNDLDHAMQSVSLKHV